jgi:hypothetical protein
MYHKLSKKLEKQEIFKAIQEVRHEIGNKKEQAYKNLRDTFADPINEKIDSLLYIANTDAEKNEIKHHVESSFLEILMDPNLQFDDYTRTEQYIINVLKLRVTTKIIKNLLNKDEIIQDVAQYKSEFKNDKQLADFAQNFLNKTPQFTLEILAMFWPSFIVSLEQKIVQDNKQNDNMTKFMDAIQNDEHLPDKILHDKELIRNLMQVLNEKLTPDQKKFFCFIIFRIILKQISFLMQKKKKKLTIKKLMEQKKNN